MAALTTIVTRPLLIIVAIPLGIFAVTTTTLAISTLALRVLLVYIELGAVLLQNRFVATVEVNREDQSPRSGGDVELEMAERPKTRKQSSAESAFSNGSMTPIAPPTDTSGLGIFGGPGLSRDFEGVGGWRLTGSTEEDELWTSMNSRLELPSPMFNDQQRRRHHRRSSTAGSTSTISLKRRSPARSRAKTPLDSEMQGAPSLGYFSSKRAASRSATSLNIALLEKALSQEQPSPK